MVLSCLGKKSERPPPASAQLVCFRALALQLRLRRLSAALRIDPADLLLRMVPDTVAVMLIVPLHTPL
jgi:hypothetical protein